MARGGYTNAHSHLDRAGTIRAEELHIAQRLSIQQKWGYVRSIKEESRSNPDFLYSRMCRVVDQLAERGIRRIGSFIDIDPDIEFVAIDIGHKVRDRFKGSVDIVFINQCLGGNLSSDCYKYFREGAERVDIIGGLPEKDRDPNNPEDMTRPKEHINRVLGIARELGKPAHIHADQNGVPSENETLMILQKVREFGMEGRVAIVHGISIAAQQKEVRIETYKQAAGVSVKFIACPRAWMDRKRKEIMAPIHNSFTPVEELDEFGIRTAIGSDNIADIMCPAINGDMNAEIVTLAIGTRFYSEVDKLVDIATINGDEALWLPTRTRELAIV